MGHQDFQDHMGKMVRMDVLEKEGILGLEETMRMQSQEREDVPDCQGLQEEQDLWGLKAWDFQAHQDREADQESREAQA